MTLIIVYTIATLSGIGVVSAIVLYLIAQKFKVYEDPRIDDVESSLPAANCGGCGFAGCRNFAEACVKSETFDGLFCPVGGNEVMAKVASVLGRDSVAKEPQVAVLLCNGNCDVRQKTNQYDGASTCAIASSLYGGETGCSYGCLGYGDCEVACTFDAIHIDKVTGLPAIIDDKCTACGACVKACPKNILEFRKRAKADRKIYVACKNEDKGAVAKKSCEVACIGCSKCFKICPYEAITMGNNLAYIDADKCKLCRKCVSECPTGSIIEVGFPPRKIKDEVATPSSENSNENSNTVSN